MGLRTMRDRRRMQPILSEPFLQCRLALPYISSNINHSSSGLRCTSIWILRFSIRIIPSSHDLLSGLETVMRELMMMILTSF